MSEEKAKKKRCALCYSLVEGEDLPVLAIGAYGAPRYLCPDCEKLVEIASFGTDYDSIVASLDGIGNLLTAKNIDDSTTLNTVLPLLEESAKRAEKIKKGEWDFTLDEEAHTEAYEIPEELLEAEEDRLLDEKEACVSKKIDKVMNWIYLAMLVGALAFIVWYFLL